MKIASILGFVFLLLSLGSAQPSDPYVAAAARLKAANALTATMSVSFPGAKPQVWKLSFLKPNLYMIIAPDQQFRSDGKVESVFLPGLKDFPGSRVYQYTQRKDAEINDAPIAFGLNAFFSSNWDAKVDSIKTAKMGPTSAVVASVLQPGFAKPTLLYIDPRTNLPMGYDQPFGTGVLEVRYQDIKINPDLKPEIFAWTPPKDAKPIAVVDVQAELLKVGSQAPSVQTKDISGGSLNLGEEFKMHKATLVYFWEGGPPIPDFDALVALYNKLRSQRLQLLLVDYNLSEPNVPKTLAALKAPFPVISDDGSVAKPYHKIPQAVYVVGPDGKILASFLGYDAGGVAKALRQLGVAF